ncbi:transcriptional regulator, GntR family [Loktanella fryxellensis]|uniref:Transcriptional regulator, GntR family n=1 Tax=Loktanella fryxellensis TaxID=245187 RepID=A0A1H8IVI5_9RHOB|nr:GntR family transcriptional regulator [Loktanella fryxellensis]SEN72482.1 transcriptional regulator, GntR family [Loktanella fryxellensis]
MALAEGRRTGIHEDAQTLSEQAYDLLRRDILQGAYIPGDKLLLDAASDKYGIGINPIREALNRLSSEGLVERKTQRGFFVSRLSIDDLEELVKARIWLETRALSESVAHANEAWEDRLVLSYHRLARTNRTIDSEGGFGVNQIWEDRHRDFHMALIENCQSSWLIGFCATMLDQSVRYRNLSVNANHKRRGDAQAEHQDIVNAVLDHDVQKAAELLENHYLQTLEGIRKIVSGQ